MSAIKKVVKGVGKFVAKHWKKIALATAVVFTAGIATVGTAGFSAASAAAGGGITGALSAAGSTLAAGVASIAGSVGIGSGVNLASFGGSGFATLGNGALAQSLGASALPGAQTAATAAKSVPSITSALSNTPSYLSAGGAAGGTTPGIGVLKPAFLPPASSVASGATSVAPAAASGGFLSSPLAGPVLMGGINALGQVLSDDGPGRPLAVYGRNTGKKVGGIGPNEVAVSGGIYDPNSFAPLTPTF